jgi:hypothetical protein
MDITTNQALYQALVVEKSITNPNFSLIDKHGNENLRLKYSHLAGRGNSWVVVLKELQESDDLFDGVKVAYTFGDDGIIPKTDFRSLGPSKEEVIEKFLINTPS